MKPLDAVMIEKILNQYDLQKKTYYDFLERTLTLIKEFIEPDGPKIHSIVGRIKEKERLTAKLHNPQEKYNGLNEVPDIAGIRIITFFEEEVQVILEIIRREFNVFPSTEQPKSMLTDPNRFGYTSISLLVGLLDNRLELIEYRRFRGFLVEVQIRSVLQHAWLEINNNLGFQTKDLCPVQKQREYARIAALLELADLELNKIKEFSYQPKPSQRVNEQSLIPTETLAPLPDLPFEPIPIAEEKIPILKPAKPSLLEKPISTNLISYADMERFVLENRLVNTYDRKIADHYDTRLIFKTQSITLLTEAFCHLDIVKITEVAEAIKTHEKFIKPIAAILFGDPSAMKYEHISKGCSLLMVCYAIVAKTGHTNTVFQYINRNYFENDPSIPGKSTELIECIQHLSTP
ncbi:MAG: RelA/SpoT domain-containing protein [Magnetococcus sp. YQC-5]